MYFSGSTKRLIGEIQENLNNKNLSPLDLVKKYLFPFDGRRLVKEDDYDDLCGLNSLSEIRIVEVKKSPFHFVRKESFTCQRPARHNN